MLFHEFSPLELRCGNAHRQEQSTQFNSDHTTRHARSTFKCHPHTISPLDAAQLDSQLESGPENPRHRQLNVIESRAVNLGLRRHTSAICLQKNNQILFLHTYFSQCSCPVYCTPTLVLSQFEAPYEINKIWNECITFQ